MAREAWPEPSCPGATPPSTTSRRSGRPTTRYSTSRTYTRVQPGRRRRRLIHPSRCRVRPPFDGTCCGSLRVLAYNRGAGTGLRTRDSDVVDLPRRQDGKSQTGGGKRVVTPHHLSLPQAKRAMSTVTETQGHRMLTEVESPERPRFQTCRTSRANPSPPARRCREHPRPYR